MIVTHDNGGPTLIAVLRTLENPENGMTLHRSILISLLFVGALAVVAQLAWTTAGGTSGSWFSSEVSRDVFSTTLVAGTVLVAVLGGLASSQSAAASREARSLDLRLALVRGGLATSAAGGIDIDRDIEETLDEILGGTGEGAAPVVTVDREAHDTLVVATAESRSLRQEVVAREISRMRAALTHASRRIWGAVAGPMSVGLLFLGIAGAMLPGSEGFLQTQYVLNTALILFLGYGWPILVGYTAVALALARVSEGGHPQGTKRA